MVLPVNRWLVKLHHLTDELVYKVLNFYTSDGRDVLFHSAPAHLIRNCFASKARNFWVCM